MPFAWHPPKIPSQTSMRKPSQPSGINTHHPHPDSTIPSAPAVGGMTSIRMLAEEVDRAIRSFPSTSTAGPDGLRPQHLKDMIEYAVREGGHLLLRALTGFTPCMPLLLWSLLICPYKNRKWSEAHCRRVYPTSTGCKVCKQQCEAGYANFTLLSVPLLIRALLGDIANINTIENDFTWSQASLPVWSSGLGVRSGTQLAPSAFLASAAGCTDIIHLLLPPRLKDTPY